MKINERVNKNTDKEDPVDIPVLDFQKVSLQGCSKTKFPEAIPAGIL